MSALPAREEEACPQTEDLCDAELVCLEGFCQEDPTSIVVCSDSDPCTTDACNPLTGECSFGPTEDGGVATTEIHAQPTRPARQGHVLEMLWQDVLAGASRQSIPDARTASAKSVSVNSIRSAAIFTGIPRASISAPTTVDRPVGPSLTRTHAIRMKFQNVPDRKDVSGRTGSPTASVTPR